MVKVASEYIGLLVLDTFNAAIGRQSIRGSYTFRQVNYFLTSLFLLSGFNKTILQIPVKTLVSL